MVTKLLEDEALEHPKRRRLYDAIVLRPGQGFRALVRSTGVAGGTANHHLNVLVRSQLIWYARHGVHRRFFPGLKPSEVDVQRYLARHALDDLDRDLLAIVRLAPRNQKALLDQFPDFPRPTVQHRLHRLTRHGFLLARPMGRRIVYHPGVPA